MLHVSCLFSDWSVTTTVERKRFRLRVNILDSSDIKFSVVLSVTTPIHPNALLVSSTPVTQEHSRRVSVTA